MDFIDNKQNFKAALDKEYNWPSEYTFRFVVPNEELANLKGQFLFFNIVSMEEKPSKTGRFKSLVITIQMGSSDQVLQVYERAGRINGIVSL